MEQERYNNAVSPLQDELNSFQFYFEFLPALWDSPERRKALFALFDAEGGRDCMGLIFRALNALLFPEQRKDAAMKAAGIKMVDDFVNRSYPGLFAVDRVNLDTGRHILEIAFSDYKSQKMQNKVEKVFLVSAADFSRGNVITLESGSVGAQKFLCEAGLNGVHSNFGPVLSDDVYESLKGVIL